MIGLCSIQVIGDLCESPGGGGSLIILGKKVGNKVERSKDLGRGRDRETGRKKVEERRTKVTKRGSQVMLPPGGEGSILPSDSVSLRVNTLGLMIQMKACLRLVFAELKSCLEKSFFVS